MFNWRCIDRQMTRCHAFSMLLATVIPQPDPIRVDGVSSFKPNF